MNLIIGAVLLIIYFIGIPMVHSVAKRCNVGDKEAILISIVWPCILMAIGVAWPAVFLVFLTS